MALPCIFSSFCYCCSSIKHFSIDFSECCRGEGLWSFIKTGRSVYLDRSVASMTISGNFRFDQLAFVELFNYSAFSTFSYTSRWVHQHKELSLKNCHKYLIPTLDTIVQVERGIALRIFNLWFFQDSNSVGLYVSVYLKDTL